MTAEELWQIREETSFIFLDVREMHEVEALPYANLNNVVHIPMGSVGEHLDDLDKSKNIIVGCKSGGRSAAVCDYLSDQGYQTYNLTGGILAWSNLQQN